METRSNKVIIGEIEAQEEKLNLELVTAPAEAKPLLIEQLNRVGRALASARETAQEVHTGKIVPSDGSLHKNSL